MSGTCTEIATGSDSIGDDAAACAAVADLSTPDECESIFTAVSVSGARGACTYSPVTPPSCEETAALQGNPTVEVDSAACNAVTSTDLNDPSVCNSVMKNQDAGVPACTYSAEVPATCSEAAVTSVPADSAACSAVTGADLDTSTACDSVKMSSDLIKACTYTPRTCADINADGTNVSFDCSSESKAISPVPRNIQCSGDTCTPTECCTVDPPAGTVVPGGGGEDGGDDGGDDGVVLSDDDSGDDGVVLSDDDSGGDLYDYAAYGGGSYIGSTYDGSIDLEFKHIIGILFLIFLFISIMGVVD